MMLAAEAPPGSHPTISLCGNSFICTFNYDTLISSGLAVIVTLALVLGVAYKLRRRTPHKLQMVLELLLGYVRNLTLDTVSKESLGFVMPLAATIFIFILLANWLDFFPLRAPVEPANADVNLTLAMALVVIVVVQWYSFRVLGFRGYFYRYTKPFNASLGMRILFVPLNVVEEVAKPLSLALRLFGNIFSGLVMVYLLTLWFQAFAVSGGFLAALSPLPVLLLVVWKIFDVFLIGTIQAFIFMLLTVIYFGMAREGLEERHHEGATSHG